MNTRASAYETDEFPLLYPAILPIIIVEEKKKSIPNLFLIFLLFIKLVELSGIKPEYFPCEGNAISLYHSPINRFMDVHDNSSPKVLLDLYKMFVVGTH